MNENKNKRIAVHVTKEARGTLFVGCEMKSPDTALLNEGEETTAINTKMYITKQEPKWMSSWWWKGLKSILPAVFVKFILKLIGF